MTGTERAHPKPLVAFGTLELYTSDRMMGLAALNARLPTTLRGERGTVQGSHAHLNSDATLAPRE